MQRSQIKLDNLKKNEENNPVLSLWHRVILDGRIYKLAIKFREKLKMPNNGFLSSDEFETWHKKVIKSKKELNRKTTTNKFIEESKRIIPYEGLLKELHFRMIMIEFFYHNNVDDEQLNEMKYSGMGVYMIKNNKKFHSYEEKIEDGVYIKIKSFSTIDDIQKYIEENRKLIKEVLELYSKSQNLIKPKKIKKSLNFKRDGMIIDLNYYTVKGIKETFGIKHMYFGNEIKKMDKYQAISLLMNTIGYEKVNPDIVKAVIQRRKMKR